MKRIILTILTVLIMLLLVNVTAFANGSSDDQSSTDLLELSVELFDRANVPQSEGTLEDNRWTRYIKEGMLEEGVNVTFFPVPRGEERSKLNTLMASGTAPDLVFTYNRLLFTQFARNGGLQDLGPAIEEFGPNVKEVTGKMGVLKYGFVEGAQYAIPATRSNPNHKMESIRADWLEKVGMDVPTTTDELVTVLKAFRDAPAGTFGVDRVIPYGLVGKADDFVPHNFTNWNSMYAFFDHSEEALITTPEPLRKGFKEFMQFMNMLYTEELLDPEFSTDTGEIAEAKITNGNVGFFSGAWWVLPQDNYHADYTTMKEVVPGAELKAIEVFQNADGNYYKAQYPPVGLYLFSPKTAGTAEGVVKYVNWMLKDEVSKTIMFGMEGEHYDYDENGLPMPIDLEHNKKTHTYIRGDLILPWNGYPSTLGAKVVDALNVVNYPESNRAYAAEANRIAGQDAVPEILYNAQIKAEEEHMPELNAIYEEYWIKMIVADNFDSVYAEFMDAIEARGIKDIQAERTEYFKSLK